MDIVNKFKGLNNAGENLIRTKDNKPQTAILLRHSSSRSSRWRSKRKVNEPENVKSSVLDSLHSNEVLDNIFQSSTSTNNSRVTNSQTKKKSSNANKCIKKHDWSTIVTIVLVQGRGLPDPPDDGSQHELYCKFRLGTEVLKSKCVPNTHQPEWRQRFQLRLYDDCFLNISLWDKGKHKNFMGRCVLDLSKLEKERTHEIWQQLEDRFGLIHLSVTMCTIRNKTNPFERMFDVDEVRREYAWYNFSNLTTDLKLVGQLHVKVYGARGLSGKPLAYCTLELDNESVQTHSVRASSEPMWDKSYLFNVYDVTTTLDVKVEDSSLVSPLRFESLGKISIPLLRVHNGEMRWYALKDKNKRCSAKGNCPRVLLQMFFIWNPVKAIMTLFRPKQKKHIDKTPKFDIALVYKNFVFMKDTFEFFQEINESFKNLFEWENRELCAVALAGWLVFWYCFQYWMTPLLLLMPFIYFRILTLSHDEKAFRITHNYSDEIYNQLDNNKEKSVTDRIQDLQELTLKLSNGIEYVASMTQKMYNLISFKVPFLSYLSMTFLVFTSIILYWISFNYILMALGTYKFLRKYLHPNRKPNNDLLDFISRAPDKETLKDWMELSVPEPNDHQKVQVRRCHSN